MREAVDRQAALFAKTLVARSTQQAPKHRHWAARHPVFLGTMIGAGVGLAWVASEGCSSSDYGCGGLVAFGAGTGALLGAAGGAVAAIVIHFS